MGRLTRDETAKPVSRDQILRREHGQGKNHFSCSADHVQDWQPYPVDPYSYYMCDHTYIQGSSSSQADRTVETEGEERMTTSESSKDGAR